MLVLDAGDIFVFPFAEKLYVYDSKDWSQQCVIEKTKSDSKEGDKNDYYSNYSPGAGGSLCDWLTKGFSSQ